jgi:hypothetical protein
MIPLRTILDVPKEWLRPLKTYSKTLRRAKRRLTATVGERAIERQCRRAERRTESDGSETQG